MKSVTLCSVGAALLVLTACALAREAPLPADPIIRKEFSTEPVGPDFKKGEVNHSDKVMKFQARRDAVEALRNALGGNDSAQILREEQDKAARGEAAEPLIVLAIACRTTHPQELDTFLTRLITMKDAKLDARVEAAKAAAFYGLPAAQQAAQALIIVEPQPPANIKSLPKEQADQAMKDLAAQQSMRFYLLRAILRGSPTETLDFVRKIAGSKAAKADFLVDYAREALACLKNAARVKRDTPVTLSRSLADAIHDGDAKTLVTLNCKPTMQPQSVNKDAIVTDSPKAAEMEKFLTAFAANPANWIVLYDTAGCWNDDFELILRQECGLWYVELGLPTPWNQ